ncbi:MAG: c-type cytochrome [Pseudobdellovibrio sp.]
MLISVLALSVALVFASDYKYESLIKHTSVEKKLAELKGDEAKEIIYGYEVFTQTPRFFGPKGIIGKKTKSRMACSQCHMDAGNRVFGNSMLDTHGTYPQYRGRENAIQTLSDRINTCFLNPLLGEKRIELDSREMKALELYIKWIGRGRPILEKSGDDRLAKLEFLERAANPEKGKIIYENSCQSCHGINGAGTLNAHNKIYVYPPLWGNESFRNGSSMSRLSIMARFVKHNMPYDNEKSTPTLTDEDAWDVSAYVLTKQRLPWKGPSPFKELKNKPFDYPIPPYADTFLKEQHQFGPFKPIIDFYKINVKIDSTRPSGI